MGRLAKNPAAAASGLETAAATSFIPLGSPTGCCLDALLQPGWQGAVGFKFSRRHPCSLDSFVYVLQQGIHPRSFT
ncbi:hypothetical protein O6P43_026905 [Quillaja saponaria]|uniref:Uncharacterized protein n=1 Tax=Quillaja saponaria TaxID=32244 RepID=A0AAD7L377_QUISA|nr:hypothetical protein O6P43_026905 [Quillaja saponaria]